MAHFAQIDHNNIVTQVIVIEPEVLALGHWGDPNSWIQTSYNTRAGIHYGPDGQPDNKPPLRKNYAGVGYSYDAVRDAFIPPQSFASWLLDEAHVPGLLLWLILKITTSINGAKLLRAGNQLWLRSNWIKV
jgi:hypothetical protein